MIKKELAKAATNKKSSWKSVLKKIWKIAFNTSAIVGVITVSGAVAMRAFPEETKIEIDKAIMDFESPIEDLLTDENDCWKPLSSPMVTFDYSVYDDPRVKEVCETIKEHDFLINESDWRKNLDDGSEKWSTASNIAWNKLFEGGKRPTNDEVEALNWYICKQDESYQSISDAIEQKASAFKSWREFETCKWKNRSEFIYRYTGERLPYYDHINRIMVYGEEQ